MVSQKSSQCTVQARGRNLELLLFLSVCGGLTVLPGGREPEAELTAHG